MRSILLCCALRRRWLRSALAWLILLTLVTGCGQRIPERARVAAEGRSPSTQTPASAPVPVTKASAAAPRAPGQGGAAGPAEAQGAELPFWASAAGLAPDPQRPGYTVAGSPYKGNPLARVAVIEFSNFQCPSCREHSLTVQPRLDQEFVATGLVLWVVKNLPSPGLPQSTAAAVAAECAGEQDRFWEMHDLLFESESQWGVEPPGPVFLRLATQLGLDVARCGTCLDSLAPRQRVARDLQDAQGVAESTPTFIVVAGGHGSILPGLGTPDVFASLLRDALRRADR